MSVSPAFRLSTKSIELLYHTEVVARILGILQGQENPFGLQPLKVDFLANNNPVAFRPSLEEDKPGEALRDFGQPKYFST